MSVGRKGSVYWLVGETVKIRLRTDGEIREDKKGRRYRAMGKERYYHFAKGRSWVEFCIAGDCPRCMQGYHPTKRYIVPLDIEGQPPRENPMLIHSSLNDAIAACVEEMIPNGIDPLTTWLSVTRTTVNRWKVEPIPEAI